MTDFKENDTLARIAENHLGFIYFWLSEGTDQMNLETEWLVHGIYRVTSSGNLIDGSFKSQYNFPLPFWAPMIEKGMSLPGHPKFSSSVQFSSVQSLSYVWLFATPWIAAHQASRSITNSWSSLRLMSIELVMPSSHLILCHPLLFLPPILPSIRVFSNELTLHMRWPKVLEFQPQHHSFQRTPRADLLQNGLVGSPCSPGNS